MTRGEKIRLGLERIGVSSKDFAKMINKSPAYVSRLLNDDPNLEPSGHALAAIARTIGVPQGFLYDDQFSTVDEYLRYWMLREQLSPLAGTERYQQFFPVIERAIRAYITPGELADSLAFMIRQRTGAIANFAIYMIDQGYLSLTDDDIKKMMDYDYQMEKDFAPPFQDVCPLCKGRGNFPVSKATSQTSKEDE